MGATNDAWKMYMLCQLYLGIKKDNPEMARMPFGNKAHILDVDQSDIELFDHVYTRLIEDKVINAIKHVENGALGFQQYYLASFGAPDHDKKKVLSELVSEFNISKSKAIDLISIILWAHSNGYLEACSAFVSMHNKGVITEDEKVLSKFEDIVKYTFLGNMFKEFYSIGEYIRSIDEQEFDMSAMKIDEDLSSFS